MTLTQINENAQEIANTIGKQIGGLNKVKAMTGAKDFVALGNGLAFKYPRGKYVKITLNGKDSIGKFPTKIKKKDRDIWLNSGEHDGETEDDKVNAKFETVKAKDLTPVQAQIYLSKAIVNFEKFGVTEDGNFLTQKTLIVDSNNMIIDGHHRWATAMIADPNIKMKVLKVDLKLSKLLKVSKSFGVAMGNKQNK